MARSIASFNKAPFQIGGILVDGANINGTVYVQKLYIINQRSDIVYDLVDEDGVIYQFVTMTYLSAAFTRLDVTEDNDALAASLPKNSFFIKVSPTPDAEPIGFLTRIMKNIVKLSTGESVLLETILNRSSDSVPVESVTVSPTTATLKMGGAIYRQLTPTVLPAEATDKSVSYTSSATGVATVSSTGLITAVSAGTADVTVTTTDGSFTAVCSVTVEPADVDVSGVTVAPESVTLSLSGTATQQLTPTVEPSDATDKSVSYSSDAESIATVSSTGLITAVAEGTANITVTTTDGSFTAVCAVTVEA